MLYLYYGDAKTPTSLGYENLDELLAHIPVIKHKLKTDKDLHFSANHCDGSESRTWQKSDLLYFDLDNPKGELKEIVKNLVDLTEIPESYWNVHSSGNGYHFFCRIPEVSNKFEYDLLQSRYRIVLGLLNKTETGIWDMVFDTGRTMRLPQTYNGDKFAHIVATGSGVFENPLAGYSPLKDKRPSGNPNSLLPTLTRSDKPNDLGVLPPEDDPNKDFYSWHGGKPDTETVLNECGFLAHCKNEPELVREPEWYAMVSIVARLEKGRELVHELSENHPNYSVRETENKINQSLAKAGPRRCSSINAIWGKCGECPHFNKVSSPIQLKSKTHIATRDQGFHTMIETGSGAKRFVPAHSDMINFLKQELNLKYLPKSKDFYKYVDGKYMVINDVEVKSMIRENYKPEVETKTTNETYKRLEETSELHVSKELDDYPMLLNCRNGVLNLSTGELMEHSPDYLFTTKINVDYQPDAKAPKFRSWLSEIMEGDEEKVQTVIDYMAYCIAGSQEFNEKVLILNGRGANGKSVLVKIIQMLLGEYFAFAKVKSFSGFGKEIIMGKRLICFEELPANTEKDFWEEIKDLSSGGTAVIDRKFKPVMNYKSKAKFIFICNTMPYGSDANHGFFRRFIIANFPKQFSESEIINHFEKHFEEELPGILNLLVERIKVLKSSYFKIEVAPSMKAALEEYREEKDVIYDYFKNALVEEGKAPRPNWYLQKVECVVKLKSLYTNHFVQWLEEGHYSKINYTVFKRRMREVAGEFFVEKDGYQFIRDRIPSLD